MTDEQKKFIESIAEKAMKDYKTYCILPSLTIAQAILESGWGKSELAVKACNLFGIKASNWTGEIYTIKTVEHKPDGTAYIITADFRKYDNVNDSIADHSLFLLKERYRPVLKCTNYKDAAVAIRECGYATDVNYSVKLIGIIEKYNLNQYDEKVKEDTKMNFKTFNLKTIFAKLNECFIRNQSKKRQPKGIVVHSTGANNPNLKRYVGPDDGLLGKNTYNNHWNTYRPGCNNASFNYQGSASNCANCKVAKKACRQVCVHAFIGKLADGTIATYQILPFDIPCWGNGSGKNGTFNNDYIQFEICEDDTNNADYFKQVYNEAVEFSAYLCNMYNIKPEFPYIVDHIESYELGKGSNHGDVRHWFPKHGKTMDDFRHDVAEKLKEYGGKVETPKEEPKEEVKEEQKEEIKTEKKVLYRVQCGAFSVKTNADNLLAKLKNAGYKDAFIKYDGKYYRVQCGAFSVKDNATKLLNELKNKGFDTYLVSDEVKEEKKETLKVGDEVRMQKDAPVYNSTRKFQSWVYNSKLYVREISGDRVVVSTFKTGAITGPVAIKYLTKI